MGTSIADSQIRLTEKGNQSRVGSVGEDAKKSGGCVSKKAKRASGEADPFLGNFRQ